jgi:hypothetical protein
MSRRVLSRKHVFGDIIGRRTTSSPRRGDCCPRSATRNYVAASFVAEVRFWRHNSTSAELRRAPSPDHVGLMGFAHGLVGARFVVGAFRLSRHHSTLNRVLSSWNAGLRGCHKARSRARVAQMCTYELYAGGAPKWRENPKKRLGEGCQHVHSSRLLHVTRASVQLEVLEKTLDE